jgi:hypothetical protein|tara:strand:- start:68 stop:337 length:270 start_codon:yes stop_codon:yes gene_type:complete
MENNDNLREQAVANIAFRVHALIYLLVNSGLLVIDLLFDNSSSINWFYYAAIGWGIGLLAHFLFMTRTVGFFSIEREVDRIKNQNKTRY